MYRHASKPNQLEYHSFLEHWHLHFNRTAGQQELRETINRLLGRWGSIYELDESGQVERLAPAPVREMLALELPPTSDIKFDQLLAAAARKHLDPDPDVRAEGLEKLWDAFERIKTLLNKDKRAGAERLIEAAGEGATAEETKLLRCEMKALTEIGNTFRIRHHETSASELTAAFSDQLFVRMYALLVRLHPAVR